ncbi:AAA family ATPase [Candidatus Sumerlaeota bacterium]|nr:AAA family ATPase [Candidatus Sumerlaeota bacterium]
MNVSLTFIYHENHDFVATRTAVTTQSADHETALRLEADDLQTWPNALGATKDFMSKFWDALVHGGSFPRSESIDMANNYWQHGYDAVAGAPLDNLFYRLSVDELKTWQLLPELAFVGNGPLSESGPGCRTVIPLQITSIHQSQKHIAVVFEKQESEWARAVVRDLIKKGLIVDEYPGGQLIDDTERVGQLREIFREHRVVLFLGHMPNDGTLRNSGWSLDRTTKQFISIAELTHAIQPILDKSKGALLPVPELIFACGCQSAGNINRQSTSDEFFASRFLRCGVRFYIGSWERIPENNNCKNTLRSLLLEFFERWQTNPSSTVQHLYDAKKALGFPLLAHLFQVYCPASSARQLDEGSTVARGALTTAVRCSTASEENTLGPYISQRIVWDDEYSIAYLAKHNTRGSWHLVEVPNDDFQNVTGIRQMLEDGIGALRTIERATGHLIPDRVENLSSSNGQIPDLAALIYDDMSPDWSFSNWLIPSDAASTNAAVDLLMIIRHTAELSQALAELHAAGLAHGNLSPACVLLRDGDAIDRIVVKGHWVSFVTSGRTAAVPYAPPEGSTTADQTDIQRADCWALGVMVFEKVTGKPPFEGDQLPKQQIPPYMQELLSDELKLKIPPAFVQTIRECLAPDPKLRPGCDLVSKRMKQLLLGETPILDAFVNAIGQRIQAGHRLIIVPAADFEDVRSAIRRLCESGGSKTYAFLTLEPQKGLIECHFDREPDNQLETRVEWRHELGELRAGIYCGLHSLYYIADRSVQDSRAQRCVCVINGWHWLDLGQPCHRFLRMFRDNPNRAPVIIVAGDEIGIPEPIANLFAVVPLLAPEASELYEIIWNFPSTHKMPNVQVSMDAAIELSMQFRGCAKRDVLYALRLCALQYGVIDTRALDMLKERQTEAFAQYGTGVLTPKHELPPPGSVPIPPQYKKWLVQWTQDLADCDVSGRRPPNMTLLLEGDDRRAQEMLAGEIARRLNRPLAKLSAATCLRGGIGESEETMRALLRCAAEVRAVVMLRDIDELSRSERMYHAGDREANRADQISKLMIRLSGAILHWLDGVGSRQDVIVIGTCAAREQLTAQWKRHFPESIVLAAPRGEYRAHVFQVALRRCQLMELAADVEFLNQLNDLTDPDQAGAVLTPEARLASPGAPLSKCREKLINIDEIEHWVDETIRLHSSYDNPRSREFWLSAAKGARLSWPTANHNA